MGGGREEARSMGLGAGRKRGQEFCAGRACLRVHAWLDSRHALAPVLAAWEDVAPSRPLRTGPGGRRWHWRH